MPLGPTPKCVLPKLFEYVCLIFGSVLLGTERERERERVDDLTARQCDAYCKVRNEQDPHWILSNNHRGHGRYRVCVLDHHAVLN